MLEGAKTADTLANLTVAQFRRFDLASNLGFAVRLQNDPAKPELYRSGSSSDIDHMLALFRTLQMACRSERSAPPQHAP